LEDELKKLGLRIRPRTVTPARAEKPAGQIAFDERGNAIYEWRDDLHVDGEDGEKARRRALAHPGLSIVDEEPNANAPIRNNHKGVRLGYNPYESGLLKKQHKKKTDLRELSKWMELKRKAQAKGSED
jgi:hypothetical protein